MTNKIIARWQSRGGKHFAELQATGRDYLYVSDGARGYFQAADDNHAILLMTGEGTTNGKLSYLFPDNQKIINRVV